MPPAPPSDVVIVGAGLAGLACAFDLADRGLRVHVLEADPVVGGRTSSWSAEGMPVESGLHRFLGFYRALPDLLRRAGLDLDAMLIWEDEIEVRPPGRTPGVFGVAPLHKPGRTVAGFIGNGHLLSARDKLSLLRFLARGIRHVRRDPAAVDAVSILEYARTHGLRPRALQHVVQPLSTGVFFLPLERYSALAFFGLFAPHLARLPGMRVGAFSGGMTEVMSEPLAAAVRARGGTVEVGRAVTAIELDGDRAAGVVTPDGRVRAGHVVVATGLGAAQRLLRPHFAQEPWCAPMLRLPVMAAATIQLDLDRPALPVDRTTFGPGTVLASFSEQSRTTFRGRPGRLSVILTPPDRFLALTPEESLDATCRDASAVGIDVRAHLADYRVVNHREDFHCLEPGYDHLRPGQETPVPGLTLAGDYTRQPYLATMEGAVVSGLRASRLVGAALAARST